MKRTALLLAILAAFSITSVSQVHASPVVGEKAVAISSWLSYYFANFLRAHRHNLEGNVEERLIVDDGSEVILRGDADDYANGRGDNKDFDPEGPGDSKLSTGLD